MKTMTAINHNIIDIWHFLEAYRTSGFRKGSDLGFDAAFFDHFQLQVMDYYLRY